MADQVRDVDARFRRRLLRKHFGFPIACVVLFWACYVLAAALNVDLVSLAKGRARNPEAAKIYLIVAALMTPVCLAFGVIEARKAIALARTGTEVVGTIVRVGAISFRGWARVESRYSLAGADHAFSWPHFKDAEKLSVGDPVALIVDPANPKRCMLKKDVLPES
jgi:hypothetical protein